MRVYATSSGYGAMTRYRDWDGHVRPVERYGRTMGAARDALATALRDRANVDASAEVSGDSRLASVAQLWFSDFQRRDRSPTTLQAYRDRLDKLIAPGLGNVRLRELSVGLVDRFLRTVEAKHGAGTAKQTKTVLGQVCGLAVRYDALASNPVRDTSPISTKPKKPPRSFTEAQGLQLLALLTYDDQAIARDIPAFIAIMLATGLRIGEACALVWSSVDLERHTLEVEANVVRITGNGLVRRPRPKTDASHRVLPLPGWSVEMLLARIEVLGSAPEYPVFPSPQGHLRDPSNTAADLKDAFRNAGFEWATSHVLRKTVASLLDTAGMSAREIADQLGHTHPSITLDRYMGRKSVSARGAQALEGLGRG